MRGHGRQDGQRLLSRAVWSLILRLTSGSIRQPWIGRVPSLCVPFPDSLPCGVSDAIGGPQAEHGMETLYYPRPKTSLLAPRFLIHP